MMITIQSTLLLWHLQMKLYLLLNDTTFAADSLTSSITWKTSISQSFITTHLHHQVLLALSSRQSLGDHSSAMISLIAIMISWSTYLPKTFTAFHKNKNSPWHKHHILDHQIPFQQTTKLHMGKLTCLTDHKNQTPIVLNSPLVATTLINLGMQALQLLTSPYYNYSLIPQFQHWEQK